MTTPHSICAMTAMCIALVGVATREAGAQAAAPTDGARRGAASRPSARSPDLLARRFAPDSFWVRDWTRGGAKEAELLVEPRQVVTAGRIAVVLDLGTREVVGFDLATGATRFTMQARGEGPGEFRRPARIAPTADGFVVLDHATARLSAFDAGGRFQWDAPAYDAPALEGLCVHRDATVLAKSGGVKDALILSDSSGRLRGRRSLPWPDPGHGDMAVSGMLAGPAATGHCVFVPRYGSQWVVVPASGAVSVRRFVTRHPDAVVKTRDRTLERGVRTKVMEREQETPTSPGASDAMTRGDTLIVRGGSDEPNGPVLLDYYLLPSGRYLHSRRLPLHLNTVTVAGSGVFIGTLIGDTWSAVIALRPSLHPPPRRP